MPQDPKRINGPDNTVPYKLYTILNTKSFKEKLSEAIKPNGIRIDKRKPDDLRKIFMKTGIVSQAKGSAYIEAGKTKVIVSVFDPREIPNKVEYSQKGELYCEFKYATFSCPQRRMHQRDAEEKQNSIILKQALEPGVCLHEFPNFQIDIYALVLENDGSAISAAITCASLALAHASVPMYDLITAVTLGYVNNTHLIDPTLKEVQLCELVTQEETQNKDHGLIVMSVLSTQKQISQFYQTGNISLNNVTKAIDLLTETTRSIVPLFEKCLVKHVIKTVADNEDREI